jgi:hypothetical protein
MWTDEQCKRLAFEENMVRKHFPEFEVYERTRNAYYLGRIKEAVFRNKYELRIELHPCHPDFEPSLFVKYPRILRTKTGEIVNDIGTSHEWHTYGVEEGEPVKICYTSDWDSSCTCLLAMHRGWLWVAAFEAHLITGKTIATIIEEWKEKLERRKKPMFRKDFLDFAWKDIRSNHS